MPKPEFMLASYRVGVADRQVFLDELIATEAAYRGGGYVTDRPIIRMASKEDPEYLLEVIEFTSEEALGRLMEDEKVMVHWGKIKSLWKDGDFAADQIPESHVPWALMKAV